MYRRLLADDDSVRLQEGFGESWVSSVCLVQLDGDAEETAARLSQAGIDTRQWWGRGAHDHPSTRALPRAALPVTEWLARSTLGIPLFRGLQEAETKRVVAGLCATQLNT